MNQRPLYLTASCAAVLSLPETKPGLSAVWVALFCISTVSSVIRALEHDRFQEPVVIKTDNQTLACQIRSYLRGNEVVTSDEIHTKLWNRLEYLLSIQPQPIEVMWIKGHSGVNANSMCDQRAKHAACAI